jgi:hypothetical protein
MEDVRKLVAALTDYKGEGDVDPVLEHLAATGEPDKSYPEDIETCLEWFGDFFFGPPPLDIHEDWTDGAEVIYKQLCTLTTPKGE